MLTLMLTLSLSAAPANVIADAPSVDQSTRTVRLVEVELRQLERKLVSAERMLPTWVPLTVGLVGGGALTAVGVFMITSVTLNYGTAFLALMAVCGGPAVLLAGVITAIVFAVKNDTSRSARVYDLREEVAAKRQQLDRLRGEQQSAVASPPLLMF